MTDSAVTDGWGPAGNTAGEGAAGPAARLHAAELSAPPRTPMDPMTLISLIIEVSEMPQVEQCIHCRTSWMSKRVSPEIDTSLRWV
jgi:hypothetical protein